MKVWLSELFWAGRPGSCGVECHLLGYNTNDTELVSTELHGVIYSAAL